MCEKARKYISKYKVLMKYPDGTEDLDADILIQRKKQKIMGVIWSVVAELGQRS